MAVALLSVLSPAALQRAVLNDDADALTLVPGIGKKTAARLILELTARFEAAAIIDVGTPGPGAGLGGDLGRVPRSRAWPTVRLSARRSGPPWALSVTPATRIRQVLARLPVEGSTQDMLRHALRELAGSS